MLRKLAAWGLVMIALAFPGIAEDWAVDGFGSAEDFLEAEEFRGEWIAVESLNFEFCLPEGWHAVQGDDSADFVAERDDGGATLRVSAVGAAVEDLVAWGETELGTYEEHNINFYDVLIEEGEALRIFVNYLEDNLVEFRFEGKDGSAIDRDLALEIVGTAYPIWEGEDFFADFLDDDTDYFELWG